MSAATPPAAGLRDDVPPPDASSDARPRVLLVGGAGRMGRWFAAYLASMGRQPVIADPAGGVEGFRSAPTLRAGLEGLGAGDAVLVCAPLEGSAACLAEVREAGTPALVADIASIKAPVVPELRRMAEAGMRVASLHPMWGPDALVLAGRNLLVMDCGHAEAATAAKALFAGTALHVHEVPLDDHDRVMGWALGLPHALNLAFSLALSRAGVAPVELELLGGPTMQAQLATARQVARENKALYHAIQAYNPSMPRVWEAVEGALKEVEAAAGRREAFAALMADCEAYYRKAAPGASPAGAQRTGPAEGGGRA